MTNFQMRLADRVVSVICLYDSTKKFCNDFLVEGEKADLSVVINPIDIQFEREKSLKEQEIEGLPPFNPSPAYLETLALYRKIADALIDYDTLLFHGSALAIDGVGYIFTAKSGTGKSTHTRLWREAFGDRVVMVNDDKPLIKITEGGAVVYGTPWCGKHNLGQNISAPLSSIAFLERSVVNRIEKGDEKKMFPKILGQTYRTKNISGLQKTFVLIDRLLKCTKIFELGCNMDIEAATVAYKGMKGE